jgi:hypothetical protein
VHARSHLDSIGACIHLKLRVSSSSILLHEGWGGEAIRNRKEHSDSFVTSFPLIITCDEGAYEDQGSLERADENGVW